MNNDTIQRILQFLVSLENVTYKEFIIIKNYLSTTEYDSNYSQLFEVIDNYYKTRNNKFPDSAWVMRQFPDYYINFRPIILLPDDIFVLTKMLKDESYKNKVLSATYSDNLEKASELLNEYKNSDTHISQAPTKATEVFKDFKDKRELLGEGILTGIKELDKDIDFLQYKNFTVLIAPTKSYKTMISCNIAYDAVINQGKNVVYITLEDSYYSIWANVLSKHSYIMGFGITTNEIKKYKLTKDRDNIFERQQRNFDASAKGNFVVLSSEHMISFTPDEIEKQLRYYEKLWGSIDMVILDHLSILNEPIPGRKDLTGPALSKEYVRFLTKLSISFSEKGFVFLGLSQITRAYTERLMQGEKIESIGAAETSEIERSCSLMLCSYANSDLKKSGKVKLSIVINRNGPCDIEYKIPVIPEYAIVGEPYVEKYDDETLASIMAGNELPVVNKVKFGISFTQFQKDLQLCH